MRSARRRSDVVAEGRTGLAAEDVRVRAAGRPAARPVRLDDLRVPALGPGLAGGARRAPAARARGGARRAGRGEQRVGRASGAGRDRRGRGGRGAAVGWRARHAHGGRAGVGTSDSVGRRTPRRRADQRERVADLPQRLGVAEHEVAARPEHLVEALDERPRGLAREVDRDVAAHDEVERSPGGERRRVGDEVVHAERDRCAAPRRGPGTSGAAGPRSNQRPRRRPRRGRRSRPEYVAPRRPRRPPRTRRCDDHDVGVEAQRGADSSASIASVYGSSPVEQPALQMRSGRPSAAARCKRSGSRCWRSASICAPFR